MKKHNPKTKADEYRRQFWADAAKHLPHHAFIKMAKAIKNDKLVKYGYKSRQEELGQNTLKSYTKKEIDSYTKTVKDTKLWHGTGRYQHNESEIVDVLSQIIAADGLRPFADSYAVMLGGEHMKSVSATPLRIIARSYADTHGKGASEANRYGSALWWVSYYYGPFYAQVFTKNMLTIARQYKKWHKATSNAQGERTWGKKANKDARHVWDVFGLGSDIPGNYPILLGVKNQAASAIIPDAMALAEVRLTHLVKLSDITHLEIPENNLADTESILKLSGLSTPVFPIELGEYIASKQSVAELLGM